MCVIHVNYFKDLYFSRFIILHLSILPYFTLFTYTLGKIFGYPWTLSNFIFNFESVYPHQNLQMDNYPFEAAPHYRLYLFVKGIHSNYRGVDLFFL